MNKIMESTAEHQQTTTDTAPDALVADGLVVRYGETTAVDGVSVRAGSGEFVALLGPSGCGKTTLLRAIAGLTEVAEGRVIIDGEPMVDGRLHVPPERRPLNMVFQSYAIWPHLTVFDNVAYGLRAQKLKKAEIRERVGETLAAVGLLHYTDRYATELSGGQQQRVALARALATRPSLMLYDEPLSNLDAGLRERVREQIVELHHQFETTTIYVTHDQSEALSMADKVVLMNAGEVAQEDEPRALYHRPNSEFAATFVGAINSFRATVADISDGQAKVDLAERPGTYLTLADAPRMPIRLGETGMAIVRPEYFDVSLASDDLPGDGANVFRGTVTRAAFVGSRVQCKVQTGAWDLAVELNGFHEVAEGDDVSLRVAPRRVIWIADQDAAQ